MSKKCPYEKGTEEYFRWWEHEHRNQIHEANQRLEIHRQIRRDLEQMNYGHTFRFGGLCLCGLSPRDYLALTPEERWKEKEKWLCPEKWSPHETR